RVQVQLVDAERHAAVRQGVGGLPHVIEILAAAGAEHLLLELVDPGRRLLDGLGRNARLEDAAAGRGGDGLVLLLDLRARELLLEAERPRDTLGRGRSGRRRSLRRIHAAVLEPWDLADRLGELGREE